MAANHHGTTQLAIDSPDLSVSRRRLTPFGENRATSAGPWPDDKGFVGGTVDPTGYTHLGARDYDPSTGRFLSVDPLVDPGDPESLNAYAYAGNNPIRFSDPDGLRRIEHSGGGAGSGPGGTSSLGGGFALRIKFNWRFWRKSSRSSSAGRGRWVNPKSKGTRSEQGMMRDRAMRKLSAKKPASPAAKSKGRSGGNTKGRSGGKPKSAKNNKPAKTSKSPSKGKSSGGIKRQIKEEIKETVKDDVSGGSSCEHSFAPDTEVLLADGSTRRIDEVAEGDQVVAHDPETGRSQAEPVTDLHVNQDVELTDLAVRTEDGEFVTLETTQNHPFWSDSRQEWVDASELRPTEVLRTATGEVVSVGRVRNFVGVATMHDLTVANLHTYYVIAGGTPGLVHNCTNEIGTQVDPFDGGGLTNAVHNQRLADGARGRGGNYGAARLDGGSIITGRLGARLHAEGDLINQAGGRRILDLYTERAPCAAKCQGKLGGVNVTWAFPWNGANAAESASIGATSTRGIKDYIRSLTG